MVRWEYLSGLPFWSQGFPNNPRIRYTPRRYLLVPKIWRCELQSARCRTGACAAWGRGAITHRFCIRTVHVTVSWLSV